MKIGVVLILTRYFLEIFKIFCNNISSAVICVTVCLMLPDDVGCVLSQA